MKPSWDDAPEWANWLAMDDDGEWYWHEEEPHYIEVGVWRSDARMRVALIPPSPWGTKEARP